MKPKNHSLSRRNFLKLSLPGAAGVFLTSRLGAALPFQRSPHQTRNENVIYRTLGDTGMRVPVISSGKIPVDNDAMAKAIMKSGIVLIDTAHGYNNGRNEEVLGRLLKDFNREDFIIATKVHQPAERSTGKFRDTATKQNFLDKFKISLERLGLDYVDIIYSHALSSQEAVLHEPTMEALQQLKDEGKARFTGISTHSNEAECVNAAVDSNFYDVVLAAFNYEPNESEALEKAMKRASDNGLGTVAMKVFAGYYHDKDNEKPVNRTAALKWVLQQKYIHTAILTLGNFVDLQQYWGVMEDLELTEDEKKAIDYDETQGSLYCPGCGDCIEECRHQLPIPDLMRAYMYTYGYHNLRKAQDLVFDLNLKRDVCADCADCLVHCPKNFDIKARVQDVMRLKDVPQDLIL